MAAYPVWFDVHAQVLAASPLSAVHVEVNALRRSPLVLLLCVPLCRCVTVSLRQRTSGHYCGPWGSEGTALSTQFLATSLTHSCRWRKRSTCSG